MGERDSIAGLEAKWRTFLCVARIIAGIALCAMLAWPAQAAELDGKARVTVGGGVDTNATRDYEQAGTTPDLFGAVIAAMEGSVTFEAAQLVGSYDGGARKFTFIPSIDVLVQAADGEASVALGRFIGLGVQARGRDRRGGERDYTDLAAHAFLDFVPDATLSVRAYGGAHRFLYWPVFSYSFRAAEFGATGRYRLNRNHSVLLFGEAGLRTYSATARGIPNDPEPPPPRPRSDNVFSVGAGYAYRGPFQLSLTYAYLDQASNSYGETTRRHRLTATGGVRLPWQLFLLAQGSLQLSSYPDGIFLSPQVILEEDAENHNSISLKLARPISEHFDVELRWALYANRLPENHLDYRRQLGWAGVTWRY